MNLSSIFPTTYFVGAPVSFSSAENKYQSVAHFPSNICDSVGYCRNLNDKKLYAKNGGNVYYNRIEC